MTHVKVCSFHSTSLAFSHQGGAVGILNFWPLISFLQLLQYLWKNALAINLIFILARLKTGSIFRVFFQLSKKGHPISCAPWRLQYFSSFIYKKKDSKPYLYKQPISPLILLEYRAGKSLTSHLNPDRAYPARDAS